MDHVEFGRYLSQQRELRGVSLEEVSRATKISVRLLLALESGQAERLPAQVFVVNHIRAYAQVIGLSPEEAVLRFEEIARLPADAATSPPERSRRGRVYRVLAAFILSLLLAGFLLAGHLLPWGR